MDQEYDYIVLGTGLKECLLSGILSTQGKKVLHMDRNSYYGGESASLTLNQLWEKFMGKDAPVPQELGRPNDYNVDLVPKFMMANGKLVQVLIKTGVTRYLDIQAVDGSYVQRDRKIYKVPATDMEAVKSSLMGLFEKRRARSFFIYVQDYEEDNVATHKGMDLKTVTMRELYKKYGLEANTIDFIGHALALHRDDSYLDQPALPTVLKIRLYSESLARFNTGAPFIYPMYGLGELPQAFARLSAVYGGTYMLNKPGTVEFDEAGKVCGVTSEGETAKAPCVIGDPSYFPGKVRRVGQVVRALCILSHPIPNTSDSHSVQIVIPQKQVGRQTDMYVFCTSYAHNVAAKGKYIATVSTTVETANPEAELAPGLALLGQIDVKFVQVSDVFEPTNNPAEDGCHISKGYDATTHFETTVEDVLEMYKRITGEEYNLEITAEEAEAAQA